MTISHDSKTFRREVTGQERRFLFAPTAHISLVLRLRGQISEESLKNAVRKMLVTYPLFGVRMEWNDDGIQWSTTEGAAEVPIKVYTRESDNSWLKALNEEHAVPLRPSKGPLTRFILVKGNDVSELIMFCHHSISDGRSLQFALREVLLQLKDPNREPTMFPEVPPMTPEIFPEGVSMSRIRSWMIGRINRKWEKERVLFDEEDLVNIWESFWKNSGYGVEMIEFDEDETQRLIEICRANDVTLNSAILITLLKSRIDAVGFFEGKTKIATAVDARGRLSIDCSDAAGFYAGGSFLEFNYVEESSLWDNVRSYHKSVGKHLKDSKVFGTVSDHFVLDQTLVDAITFLAIGDQVEPHQSRYTKITEYACLKEGVVVRMLERMSGNIPNIMSTNLGKVDFPDEIPGIQVERAFFTPSAGQGMEIVVGVVTVNGRLTITLNYYHGYSDSEGIRRTRDRAEEIFRGLIEE